jgi:hypothetical protein
MTLDIRDLYVNIPTEDIIHSTEFWFKLQSQDTIMLNQIKKLLKTVLQQNYFHYEDSYYKPMKGIAMGSPISSLASELILQYHENRIIKHWLETDQIKYYRRYVDDILLIYNNAKISPEQVTQAFNDYSNNLEFTATTEENRKISYLDLDIHRTQDGIQLGIYRKPTYTDTTIQYKSTHPLQHKLSAYRYLINRMNILPITNKEKEKEWSIIQNIGMNNGFPLKDIHRLRHNIETRSNTQKEKTTGAWVKFTFYNPLVYRVTNLFKTTSLNITYKPTNTIKRILQFKKEIDPFTEAGIYKIECNTCNKAYVGQSGREIKTRIKEHISYIRTNKPTSAFAQHILDRNHDYGNITDNVQILKRCQKGKLMNCWEALYIQKLKQEANLINEQVTQTSNPLYNIHPASTIS